MSTMTIDELEAAKQALAARQRSLTARIKAERKKADDARAARLVAQKVELADWLIGQLCGDVNDELLDMRADALRVVFSDDNVSSGIGQMVRAATHDPLENLDAVGEHHAP